MNIFEFSNTEVLAFILVLIRVSVFFALWPVFGVVTTPTYLKILTSIAISLILFSHIEWRHLQVDIESASIIFLAFREVFVGLVLTFVARTVLYAVNVCGQLVSMSIGLSNAEVLNPTMDQRISAVENTQILFATLMFLSWNGHHIFLNAMSESFALVPLSAEMTATIGVDALVHLVQGVVVVGIKLSGPVIACIFFMNVALGLAGRAVPQINILITSFPANIMMGFFIILVTLPAFFLGYKIFINETGENLFRILKSI